MSLVLIVSEGVTAKMASVRPAPRPAGGGMERGGGRWLAGLVWGWMGYDGRGLTEEASGGAQFALQRITGWSMR